jgi:hypothetical protein
MFSYPAVVLDFLVRSEPFTTARAQMGNGTFGHSVFKSIPQSWASVNSDAPDFRELTPEFFSSPEFLINADGHQTLADVVLPRWADSPASFVFMNRMALESPLVSSRLHLWIDLTFGVKQRSEEDGTLFHPYAYLPTPKLEPGVAAHILNCGVCPDRIFSAPHPARGFRPLEHDLLKIWDKPLKMTPFCLIDRDPLKFSVTGMSILVLFQSGDFSFFTLSFKTGLTLIEKHQIDLPARCDSAQFALLPARNIVVLSAPWSPVVILRSSAGKSSELPTNHRAPVTALTADSHFCVSADQLGAVLVSNLLSEKVVSKIFAHTAAVAAVAISAAAELVVSCDVEANLVFSSLPGGHFIHKTRLEAVPTRILISAMGFCVLLFEKEADEKFTSVLRLSDLRGRVLGEKEVEGKCCAAKIFENKDASAFLVTANENAAGTGDISVLCAWNLKQVCAGTVPGKVADISYDEGEAKMFFVLDSGEVHACSVGTLP